MGVILFKRCAAMLALLGNVACAYTPAPTQVAPGSEVGGTGNIRFDHRSLNANTHSLTVHISPGILETEGSMSQRMLDFANQFAAKTCVKRFDFITDPNPDFRASELTQRTKVYIFRCS